MERASLRHNVFAYMIRRAEKTDLACCAVGVALLLLMALHWHRPGTVIASVDIAPQIDYWWQLRSGFLAWNYSGSAFGAISTGLGVMPYLALGALLQVLIGASWAQIAILWLLLSASWLGAYVLARRLLLSPLAALIVAAGYTLNPYQQLQISVVTFAWMLAILPWLAGLFLRAMNDRSSRPFLTIVTTVVTLLALSVLSITPQLLFEITVDVVILQLCFMALVRPDRDYWTRFLPVTAASMLLVSLWWLIPLAFGSHGSTITHPLATTFNAWIYDRASLLENLRFTYSWAWPAVDGYFPFTEWYDANPLTYVSGFTLFIGACASMLVTQNGGGRFLRRLFIAALAMMFIAKGVHQPLAGLNDAFLHLPLMFLYQEPAGGTALATLALAICTGFFVERMLQARIASVLVPAATLVLLGCSAAVMITGEIFHGADRALPSMYVQIPSYWYDAARYLRTRDARGGDGKALILPANKIYEAFYSFGFYGLDAVPQLVLRRPLITLGASLGYFSDDIQASLSDVVGRLIQTRSALLPVLLQRLGIRYVIIRGDVVSEDVPTVSVDSLARTLHTRPQRFGPLAIFVVPSSHNDSDAVLQRRYSADAYANWPAGDREEAGVLFNEGASVDIAAIPKFVPQPSTVNFDTQYSHRLRKTTLPVRSIWHGPQALGYPTRAASGSVARASFANVPENRDDATIALRLKPLTTLPAHASLPTPQLDHIVTDRDSYDVIIGYHDNRYKVFIVNPAQSAVRTNVSIAFAAPFPAQGRLIDAMGAIHSAAIPSSSSPVWGTFDGVALKPGLNLLRLQLSAGAPPFKAVSRQLHADGFREFALSFGQAHPFAWHDPRPNPKARLIGGTPLGVSADAAPLLELDLEFKRDGPRAPVGLILEIRRAGVTSACYSPVRQSLNDLKQSVIRCLRDRGIVVTLNDLRYTEIVSAYLMQSPERTRPPEVMVSHVDAVTLAWRPNALMPEEKGHSVSVAGELGLPYGAIVRADILPVLKIGNSTRSALFRDAANDDGWMHYITPEELSRAQRGSTVTVNPQTDIALRRIYPEERGFAATSTPLRIFAGPGAYAHVSSRGFAPAMRLVSTTSNLSILGIGPVSSIIEEPVPAKALPLGMYVYDLPPTPGLLVTNLRYSGLWSALYIRGFGHLAVHTQANGWRNAWFVRGGGKLLMFNDMNILAILLEIFAVAYVAFVLPALLKTERTHE